MVPCSLPDDPALAEVSIPAKWFYVNMRLVLNMYGIQNSATAVLAAHAGMSPVAGRKAEAELLEAGLIQRDGGLVWLKDALKHSGLRITDPKHIKNVRKFAAEELPAENPVAIAFKQHYPEWFRRPLEDPTESLVRPLVAIEVEVEQKREVEQNKEQKKKKTETQTTASNGAAGSAVCVFSFSEEFWEEVLSCRAKRPGDSGSNAKASLDKLLKSGHTASEVLDALRAWAKWVERQRLDYDFDARKGILALKSFFDDPGNLDLAVWALQRRQSHEDRIKALAAAMKGDNYTGASERGGEPTRISEDLAKR